jgi:hypothetical protein
MMIERLRWFGRRWWAEWNWLIDKTPFMRPLCDFYTARGAFDYRSLRG